VRWASAGHDPAIVFEPTTGEFHELDGGDIPLGVDERIEYADYRSRQFEAGSLMIVGTDGVWETFSEGGELYGKDRLRELLRDNSARTARQIAVALEADLDKFRGACSVTDDVTFVIVKFLNPVQASDNAHQNT
jgi:sigma-B regulation protein RsbU (phosphoserine phosphatase)